MAAEGAVEEVKEVAELQVHQARQVNMDTAMEVMAKDTRMVMVAVEMLMVTRMVDTDATEDNQELCREDSNSPEEKITSQSP